MNVTKLSSGLPLQVQYYLRGMYFYVFIAWRNEQLVLYLIELPEYTDWQTAIHTNL